MQDIICKTNYDYETLFKFNKFVVSRKRKYTKLLNVVFYILSVLFLAVAIYLIVAEKNTSSGVVLIVCSLVTFLAVCYTQYIAPVVVAKKQAKSNTSLTFVFTEEDIKIEAVSTLITENIVVKYDFIKEYFENDNHFYLFVSMNQAYLVNADLLETSNENALRTLLANKVKSKK